MRNEYKPGYKPKLGTRRLNDNSGADESESAVERADESESAEQMENKQSGRGRGVKKAQDDN